MKDYTFDQLSILAIIALALIIGGFMGLFCYVLAVFTFAVPNLSFIAFVVILTSLAAFVAILVNERSN